ncbi:hypothetical protein CLOM_g15039 [Closterium sp. NIES-68]|nr:hypothetical protein CLOM_g15039 [Closterium sp. NIES-68]GJP72260.1 hypothetical protein CLOP_g3011 [Closterium sp. NIES-67]
MASHVPSATTAKSTDATASGTNGGNRSDKVVWVMTQAKEVVTAALEAGWGTVVVEGVEEEGDGGAGKKAKRKGAKDGEEITEGSARSVEETREAFEKLGRVRVVTRRGGAVYGTGGERVAAWVRVSSAGEQEAMCALAGQEDVVVMDAEDWKVIPAENAVAAFAPTRTSILGVATTAQDAQVLLESLEVGLDGVVLRTSDPTHVFSLKSYLSLRSRTASQVALVPATVTAVAAAGMGHRVCVDLCSLLPPGAGLLVGSFARGLFLVHAECLQSDYVASRPFRVNAGPVHSYVAVPGGRTAYLSELTAGSTVLVVERTGQTWPATVGRVKVEARPLTLVSAKVPGHDGSFSIILQNAETVRLVSPIDPSGPASSAAGSVSVSELKEGDQLLLAVQQSEGRHTGIAVQEFVREA